MLTARNAIGGALLLGLGAFSYAQLASARSSDGHRFRPAKVSKTINATAVAASFNQGDFDRSGPDAPRAAKVDAENYTVEAKASDSYVATREGSFRVEIQAKGAYHLNPQFPIRFKTSEPPENISYSKAILTRDDGEFKETNGSFRVPFSATKPGKYTLGGMLSVSFCSEKNCVMEKVPLDLDVVVK